MALDAYPTSIKHTSDLHIILYAILKYKDEGEDKKIQIIRIASDKWKVIASLICAEANQTNVLERKYQNDPEELDKCSLKIL